MYEKNGFQFLLFIVCIGNKCADNVGRMSTEDAGKLSVGTSVWLVGDDDFTKMTYVSSEYRHVNEYLNGTIPQDIYEENERLLKTTL